MKVPELRHRILFTLAMIVVVRLGVQIPLPGIDVMELQKVIEASANASGPGAGLATVLTIFSGGGLQQCGIFALGMLVGAAMAHNLGTASSGTDIGVYGMQATIIGFVVCLIIGFVHSKKA